MEENRDSWWSGFFSKTSIICDAAEVDDESTALLLPVIGSDGAFTGLDPISLRTLRMLINCVEPVLQVDELTLIISSSNSLHQTACTLAALRIGAVPHIVSAFLVARYPILDPVYHYLENHCYYYLH
ncbi:unnamed protein product [Gongylonema pulchrum]|uniref:RNase_PH domain-containing protein n=1 Tax=Gongylonema pulchrum TaxID=637853 RepID=A0A183D738_9BILA|nr:unnamed protein product [Gongylonema pulchrum]